MQTIKDRALPTIADKVEFRFSHFVKDTGVIGAAMMGRIEAEKAIIK